MCKHCVSNRSATGSSAHPLSRHAASEPRSETLLRGGRRLTRVGNPTDADPSYRRTYRVPPSRRSRHVVARIGTDSHCRATRNPASHRAAGCCCARRCCAAGLRDPGQGARHAQRADSTRVHHASAEGIDRDGRGSVRRHRWILPRDGAASRHVHDPRRLHGLLARDPGDHAHTQHADSRPRRREARADVGDPRRRHGEGGSRDGGDRA